ncbi:MAG: TRAP transporter large permease [Bacteriovoracaceae bacterium]
MEILIFSSLFLLALCGVPLFVIISAIALCAFSLAGEETMSVAVEMYRLAAAPTLLTIPLFTLAGNLMAESKTPQRLFRVADALLSWLPGGVAIVGLVICAFFTAFTGASGVTIIALGGLLYPILKSEGYDEKFILGLLTAAGSLGLLFPPSLPIILYGLVAKVDIDMLFKAGIVPGIFLIAVLSGFCLLKMGKGQKREKKAFSLKELMAAVKAGFWELLLPIFILGGIYGGLITTTEASVLTLVYVIIIEFFIYKDLSFKKHFADITTESMALVGSILIILCCAMGLTNYLVDEEVPYKILNLMQDYLSNKYAFLFFLNIFLLVVGAMMDIFSAIIVVVPLIIPIAEQFGIHPVHLAVIFLTNLEIGYITPPVGINLFISSYKFKKPITELYKVSIPFLIILLLALMVITYVPELSLWLVK